MGSLGRGSIPDAMGPRPIKLQPKLEAQEKCTCDQANARKQKTHLADALSDDEAFP